MSKERLFGLLVTVLVASAQLLHSLPYHLSI